MSSKVLKCSALLIALLMSTSTCVGFCGLRRTPHGEYGKRDFPHPHPSLRFLPLQNSFRPGPGQFTENKQLRDKRHKPSV
ncbi:hypothetical protein Mapa_001150 [Marchantia paleacea]|nr:hypothetical protein Mapa_001150 [Marchantia paleacea]